MIDRRINVLGVGVSVLTLDSAADAVLHALAEQRQGYVTVTGVHGISECQRDAALRQIHNQSLLTTPDGMPLTWIGRWQGANPQEMDRVYGPELMLEIFRRGSAQQLRHFLYGGGEGVAELLRDKLRERFPEAQVVGTYTPPFRPLEEEEERQLVGALSRKNPDCLWVGLSTPKQERFMAGLLSRHREALPKPLILFGVGAAFDFHAGRMPQAPRWMQRAGLEWFYRLQKEPRRLWKRYLKNNPQFVLRVAMQLSGIKNYELPEHVSCFKANAGAASASGDQSLETEP